MLATKFQVAANRRNSLQPALTGDKIALPTEDVARIVHRFKALRVELAPKTEMGQILVGRVATQSVRMERGVVQESAALSKRIRHAEAAFTDERLAQAEHLFSWIAAEPATNARRLRQMPEGIDLMVKNLIELREGLRDRYVDRWDWHHSERVNHLMGHHGIDLPYSRLRALTESYLGDDKYLRSDDPKLIGEARRVWARERIGELIEDEVARLRALRETLNFEAIEEDRADAGRRAMFDPSPEAAMARRYEAAAERGMYRALRELQEVEAAAAEGVAAVVDGPSAEELASFGEIEALASSGQVEELGSFSPTEEIRQPEPETADRSVARPVFPAQAPRTGPIGAPNQGPGSTRPMGPPSA